MFTSKTLAAILAALTLATTIAASSGEAQARPRWGWIGAGIATGVVLGAAAASTYDPLYVEPGYARCRYVERVNAAGYVRIVRVCDVIAY